MSKVPKLLTIDEVAAMTHSPPRTVQYWIYSAKLKSMKVGRRRLVTEDALRQFLGLALEVSR